MGYDYEALGFKCGIEIHQQLETHKLFCKCPSIVHDSNPDIMFERRLRAVEGETGKKDDAAKFESSKNKKYVYQGCKSSSCLVEMDEEPPHPVNKEALEIVLQVAKMLNAKIADQVQFMRKTVVDGSNVSGFQRTGLIATDGYIETSKGRVNIPNICLEEEAAKKVSADKNIVTYRLDRLGVALIEIATDASIKDPEHAKEVSEKLGMILRSTGKVKRGIGTIRQDVNVSIAKGARIEVKGFQDLKSIPAVIENEIKRQIKIVESGKKVEKEVRKAESDGSTSFLRPMPGAARMYPETDIPIIKVEVGEIEIPESIPDKMERYSKEYGLNSDAAKMISKSPLAKAFDENVKKYGKENSGFISTLMFSMPKEIRRKEGLNYEFLETDFDEVLSKVISEEIPKDSVAQVMTLKAKGEDVDYSKFKGVSDDELKIGIKEIIEKNKGAPMGALMGKVMAHFKGKADGKKVSEILRNLITQ